MPQDAPLSQRNNAVGYVISTAQTPQHRFAASVPNPKSEPPDWIGGAAERLFHVMRVMVPRPVVRVMAPWMVIWGRVRLHRRGLGRRVALVLLCCAHRPHRQFETRVAFDIGCRGKRWDDDDEGAGRDQARSATIHDVHHEGSRKQWITPTSSFYHNLKKLTG
jgi:hypothetical protein